MRSIGVPQRRARLVRRHRLAPDNRTGEVLEIVRDLVALHSTDPASVFLSIMARSDQATVERIERALYDDRDLLRMLAMRRTVWVLPADFAAVAYGACTREITARERATLVQLAMDSGVTDDGDSWVSGAEKAILEALTERGEAAATELAEIVPAMRDVLRPGQGTRWETVQAASHRLLFVLSASGRIVRARPRGSWISSQYRWALASSWLPREVVGHLTRMPADDAIEALVRAWLWSFGPATVSDIAWWTKLNVGLIRRALSSIPTRDADLDGVAGLVLDDDVEPLEPPAPAAALLPALDPTVMGWKERSWYLGDHTGTLFDRSGNAGPTVWWDGRVVGGWAQRPSGEVAYKLLEDCGAEARAGVEAEAGRLQDRLGDTRVTPRFRTPLERELSG